MKVSHFLSRHVYFDLLHRYEKQCDLAEQIESVAYVICGDNKISADKFYQIFQEKWVRIYRQTNAANRIYARLSFIFYIKAHRPYVHISL